MQDLLERAFAQLEADDEDQRRDGKAGQIFDAGVAVGMLIVGRTLGEPEAQQRDERGGRVGQVVHGVGHDGHRAREQTGGQLRRKEQQIADDPDRAGQLAVGRAHLGIFRITVIFHKQTEQQIRHISHSL